MQGHTCAEFWTKLLSTFFFFLFFFPTMTPGSLKSVLRLVIVWQPLNIVSERLAVKVLKTFNFCLRDKEIILQISDGCILTRLTNTSPTFQSWHEATERHLTTASQVSVLKPIFSGSIFSSAASLNTSGWLMYLKSRATWGGWLKNRTLASHNNCSFQRVDFPSPPPSWYTAY